MSTSRKKTDNDTVRRDRDDSAIRQMEVKGPKGTLKTPIPAGVRFKQEEGTLTAERAGDDKAAFHGLARALWQTTQLLV